VKTAPIAILEDDNDVTQFEESNLTPPATFSYEDKLESTGIPIVVSPAFDTSKAPTLHMDMSPVDSLASSFQTMDFYVGSQPHSLNEKMRQARGSVGNTAMIDQFDIPTHVPRSAGSRDMGDLRSRSNTLEDFGVMGKPEGI